MKQFYTLIVGLLIISGLFAEDIKYPDNWGSAGFTVNKQTNESVTVNFSIENFSILSVNINGKGMQELSLPNVILPNDEGAPNLPGTGRFIAVPNGATAELNIINIRTESYFDVDIAPSPRIPWDTETDPLEYNKNGAIYNSNKFYPENPFKLSEQTEIRGIEAVMLGITPFQYNPITKELKVYRDIEIEITFINGSDDFGNERLRNRWWDPIIRDMFLNESSIPELNYNKSYQGTKDTGCEYLIISPNDQEFQNWADTIKHFRTLQGIMSDVITIDEIGGNNVNTLENFFNDAYNNWDIVPSAVLLLGDYGTNAGNRIISPIWDYYCASDNIYADVTNNDMPDMIFARITAQNEDQLEVMISKFLNYEVNPPTNPDFYNHPITALGWQTERWFQICSETVGGYWKHVLGKEPVRINEVYGGNPATDPWSTASNTYTVLNVFGPNGLNYIPQSPSDLGDWSGGDAGMVNDAINDGAFVLQHRDHGYEQGWGEPGYSSNNINALTNTDLTFIFSVNCLTGKYNLSGECFTEKFHRYTNNNQNSGALGLIAASEVSYSFVNDTYVWGLYDNLWPDFMPQYGTTPDSRGVLPAFGNAAGKYFLQQSSWPYNTGNKEVTYNLFHHHGDAFLTLFTEVPQKLTVLHNDVLLEGVETFSIYADENSFIALTINGEIIGTAEGTGEMIQIPIPGQTAGLEIVVTVTKQNYYRYETTVDVIPSDIAYVVQESFSMNDDAGNGNGLMDYGETISLSVTLQNIGSVQASNVTVILSTESNFITITDNSETFGDLTAGNSLTKDDAFAFDVDNLIPDNTNILFEIEATDGTDIWISQFIIKSHAPVMEFVAFEIDDTGGNNNGRVDPGETVDITVSITNSGSSEAFNIIGELASADPYITLNSAPQNYGNMATNVTSDNVYSITADVTTPEGIMADFDFNISGDSGINGMDSFSTVIGQFLALVLDLEQQNYSGPGIYETFNDMEIYADYATDFPEDIGLYKNLFVCLGLHFTNYELSQDEGQILKDYLLNGGNIWLEGRVTWKDDTPTPVHSMFNINIENQNMFILSDILGISGTLSEGTSFVYDGHNPVADYELIPEYPAFDVFTIQDPFYSCGVAYNAGDYRTIGTTFELGKILDGSSPSTKVELMQKILSWFDGTLTGFEDPQVENLSQGILASYPNPFTGNTTLKFSAEDESNISLKIYNIHGELIQLLVNDELFTEGIHEILWEGKDEEGNPTPAGVYFGVLQTKKSVSSFKLILTK